MKKIEEMTKEEVLKEIRQFEDEKFNHNKRFVFVSYSHMDMDVVLKMVLEWIRDGYNIAIDLDFENHTSDTSWIDLMEKRLRSDLCVQAVCFRSSNYYYSYASLIEILLLRSDYLIDKRHGENALIPIDIYTITNPIKIIDNDIDSAIYEKKYYEMKNNVGSGNKLFDKNEKEKNEFKIGLETLCKKLDSKNKSKGNPDKIISDIEEKFNDTYIDYYNIIFSLFDAWFSVNDMNGNFKDLNYNPRPTFDKQKVYKITESQIKYDTQEKVIVESNHTNNINNDTAKFNIQNNNSDDNIYEVSSKDYNARYKIVGDSIIILKGSKINYSEEYSPKKIYQNLVDNHKINEDGILLDDVEPLPRSTAGRLIKGVSTNGADLMDEKRKIK